MSEKTRRLWAGAEAQALGRGGIAAVSRATGISRATISGGAQELAQGGTRSASEVRVRRQGGGRKPVTEADPSVVTDLEQLVEPATRGDPQSALRWTCKSTAKLAEEIEAGIVNVTRRVLPAMMVTAVAGVVTAVPPDAGVRLTVTLAGVIVPVGKLEPVTEVLVTPGCAALGKAVATPARARQPKGNRGWTAQE